MKSSGFQYFQLFWKIYEIMSTRRTANSHSKTPSEKNNDNNNHTENTTKSTQDETSVEPNTNPTENTQQNPLQNPESSYFEILTVEKRNLIMKLQEQPTEAFSSEQTQAANQLMWKQDSERNQLVQ